jgi:nucleotide-binding universal stress UspA family protein
MSRPAAHEPCGRARRKASRTDRSKYCAVVGFDKSIASFHALAYAIGWSRRLGGQLHVVHVPEVRWPWVVDPSVAAYPLEDPDDHTRDIVGAISHVLVDSGLPWTYRQANGDTAHALEQYAAVTRADAIIIGRPRHRFARRSSTADRLLDCTTRTVIVVP